MRLLVLTVLTMKQMSGYEIKVVFETSDVERWGGILIGSIYHALKKMEQEGYVAIAQIESTGHRQRAIYKITEKGEKYRIQLVEEALSKKEILYPTSLYASLSFLDGLPTEVVLNALSQRESYLEKEYREIKIGENAKRDAMGEMPPLVQLTFDNMYETIESQKKFIEKVRNLLHE